MFEPADRSAVPAARPPLNAQISETFAQLPWAASSCRRPPRTPRSTWPHARQDTAADGATNHHFLFL